MLDHLFPLMIDESQGARGIQKGVQGVVQLRNSKAIPAIDSGYSLASRFAYYTMLPDLMIPDP